MNKKAVALFSGGLDSMLAIKLMLEQGIEIHALNFLTVFCTCTKKGCMHQATKSAEELGVPLKVMNITMEYMEIVKHPKFGRGRNMNPCIDCRIFTFKKAKAFMEACGAGFIVTGEVLGQRPMSQKKHTIELIEKESGLKELIVRPLSAKFFKETIPEKIGIVDRNKLLDITGRSRARQIKLAEDMSISDFPCPAGGCLLTDRSFANRVRDLFTYIPDYTLGDIHLLKIGRQFRLNKDLKLIVGRDEKENEIMLSFMKDKDYIFDVIDIPSPVALTRGNVKKEDIDLIASILARHADVKDRPLKVSYTIIPNKTSSFLTATPIKEDLLEKIRI